jgi:hypothetical protein
MVHTSDVPPRSRVAEGWAIVGIVTFIAVMLWLAI